MNTTKMSPESTMTQPDKQWREVSTTETDLNTTQSALTVSQDAAICFAAGVIGAAAVVVCSYVLFGLGISGALGVNAPLPLKSPGIYKPLFWGGLWGVRVGAFIKDLWD